MELHFARSFLFYGTEMKPNVLLPPYVDEAIDFLRLVHIKVGEYRDDSLKREVSKRGNRSSEGEVEFLTKIIGSSSDILFLLS